MPRHKKPKTNTRETVSRIFTGRPPKFGAATYRGTVVFPTQLYCADLVLAQNRAYGLLIVADLCHEQEAVLAATCLCRLQRAAIQPIGHHVVKVVAMTISQQVQIVGKGQPLFPVEFYPTRSSGGSSLFLRPARALLRFG